MILEMLTATNHLIICRMSRVVKARTAVVASAFCTIDLRTPEFSFIVILVSKRLHNAKKTWNMHYFNIMTSYRHVHLRTK